MSDVLLSWQKSPDPVVSYALQWTLNGAAVTSASVPQSSGGDASGYSVLYSASNPNPLNPGDQADCSIVAVSAAGLKSTAVTPPAVTIPAAPVPGPPTAVTLALVP